MLSEDGTMSLSLILHALNAIEEKLLTMSQKHETTYTRVSATQEEILQMLGKVLGAEPKREQTPHPLHQKRGNSCTHALAFMPKQQEKLVCKSMWKGNMFSSVPQSIILGRGVVHDDLLTIQSSRRLVQAKLAQEKGTASCPGEFSEAHRPCTASLVRNFGSKRSIRSTRHAPVRAILTPRRAFPSKVVPSMLTKGRDQDAINHADTGVKAEESASLESFVARKAFQTSQIWKSQVARDSQSGPALSSKFADPHHKQHESMTSLALSSEDNTHSRLVYLHSGPSHLCKFADPHHKQNKSMTSLAFSSEEDTHCRSAFSHSGPRKQNKSMTSPALSSEDVTHRRSAFLHADKVIKSTRSIMRNSHTRLPRASKPLQSYTSPPSLQGRCLQLYSTCMERVFGIVQPNVRLGIEGWQGTSVALLIYGALFVPIQLSFWDKDTGSCTSVPTLYFDMFVDIFFCIEVALHAFQAVEVNGRYVDTIEEVTLLYVRSGMKFWFDIVTSFPFAWVEWIVLQDCLADHSAKSHLSSSTSLLKLFKLLRFMKILKLQGILDDLLNTEPATLRVALLAFGLFLSCHLATCIYWKVKVSSSEAHDITSLLTESNVPESSISDLYVFNSYLVFSFLSTIGYTEISNSNTSERSYVIVLMVLGICMLSIVMAEIQRVIQSWTRVDHELEDHLTSVIDFFRTYKVPRSLERSVKKWSQLRFRNERAEMARRAIIQDLPEELSLALAVCLDSELFSHVSILSRLPSNIMKVRFIAQLVLLLKSACFRAHHMVASHASPADRLVIITSGRIKICAPQPAPDATDAALAEFAAQQSTIFVMNKGESFGACSILGDKRWAGEYGIDADFISEDDCSVAYIEKEDILRLLLREEFQEIKQQFDEWSMDLDAAKVSETAAPMVVAIRTTFHWIRLARKLRHRASQWRLAISKFHEAMASDAILDKAVAGARRPSLLSRDLVSGRRESIGKRRGSITSKARRTERRASLNQHT